VPATCGFPFEQKKGWHRVDRRSFVKALGLAGGSALAAGKVSAGQVAQTEEEFLGVLIDTTRCAGCRACEYACAEANGLPEPTDDDCVYEPGRTTSETQLTVVRYTEDQERSAKTQCMHCNQPACASACLTKAMYKTREGPVIWRENKCMGCRFCMVSCPYDVPKFEYQSANPRIRKCTMCWSRIREGGIPACVEACPGEALTFGKRRELIAEARSRIVGSPDEYVDHIYGEHEAGGSSVLYLASVPFEQLGLRAGVGTQAYPELTKEFLYGVPIVLLLWPPMLLGLNRATRREDEEEESEVADETA
jgi:Fe-S-cluster-containing dehydrogenase component